MFVSCLYHVCVMFVSVVSLRQDLRVHGAVPGVAAALGAAFGTAVGRPGSKTGRGGPSERCLNAKHQRPATRDPRPATRPVFD